MFGDAQKKAVRKRTANPASTRFAPSSKRSTNSLLACGLAIFSISVNTVPPRMMKRARWSEDRDSGPISTVKKEVETSHRMPMAAVRTRYARYLYPKGILSTEIIAGVFKKVNDMGSAP